MTHDDYQATGINAFANLENLLKTRREMLQTLINIVDGSQHKVTAYGALKAARVHFDKAVLDELQKIIDSHKTVGLLEKSTTEPTKTKMTDEQKKLSIDFYNSLVNLKSYIIPHLNNNGISRYVAMANEVYLYGKKLLADWKNQFEE